MAIFDNRTSILDDESSDSENVTVASSKTTVVEAPEGVKEIPVNVPPGAATLTVPVTATGDAPAATPPAGIIAFDLHDPDGRPVPPIAPPDQYGRIIVVVENPRSGGWRTYILERMYDVSLDQLVEEACVRMQMCTRG
jgi:PhoPQ-activated pathogenicity-related protein